MNDKNNESFIGKISFSVKAFVILDIILVIFLVLFNLRPDICETFFSKGLYPVSAYVFGRLTDYLFFSLTELTAVILVMVFGIRIILAIWQIIRKKLKFYVALKHFIKQGFVFLSLFMFWFYFAWGFNYFRKPIDFGIKADNEITDEYFNKVMEIIIKRSNEFYVKREMTLLEVNQKANAEISKTIGQFSKMDIRPAKKYKFSMMKILSNTNTLGVISPFFLEMHISRELFDSEMPSVLTHEKSHLYGYADEAEANLLSFLACSNSDDEYFKYSAYSELLPYFFGAYIKKHKKEEYTAKYMELRPEIREEFTRMKERYENHDSKLNKMLMDAYDWYLKANNVSEGTESYSQVVELILKNGLINTEEQ